MHVIYPGIDLAEYEEPGEPAEIPGITAADKVIMYVGSIVHPNQGVPLLIDALPRVFAAVPESRCVLVGGPAEAAEEYRAGWARTPRSLLSWLVKRLRKWLRSRSVRTCWCIPGWRAARTIRCRARSPSTWPRGGRSWRRISATTSSFWGLRARASGGGGRRAFGRRDRHGAARPGAGRAAGGGDRCGGSRVFRDGPKHRPIP